MRYRRVNLLCRRPTCSGYMHMYVYSIKYVRVYALHVQWAHPLRRGDLLVLYRLSAALCAFTDP